MQIRCEEFCQSSIDVLPMKICCSTLWVNSAANSVTKWLGCTKTALTKFNLQYNKIIKHFRGKIYKIFLTTHNNLVKITNYECLLLVRGTAKVMGVSMIPGCCLLNSLVVDHPYVHVLYYI